MQDTGLNIVCLQVLHVLKKGAKIQMHRIVQFQFSCITFQNLARLQILRIFCKTCKNRGLYCSVFITLVYN